MKIIPVSIVIPYKKDPLSLWFQKRLSKDELHDLLEFPGGKIEKGENPKEAALREFSEEVGVNISNIDLFKSYKFDNLIIYVFLFEDKNEVLQVSDFINLDEVKQSFSKILPNNKKIITDVEQYFSNLGVI